MFLKRCDPVAKLIVTPIPRFVWHNRWFSNNLPYGIWLKSEKKWRDHLSDDIMKFIFFIENFVFWFKKSLKVVPHGQILSAYHYLNQRWPSSLTHICVTKGQWVDSIHDNRCYLSYNIRNYYLINFYGSFCFLDTHTSHSASNIYIQKERVKTTSTVYECTKHLVYENVITE